jgi:hypothetical protein
MINAFKTFLCYSSIWIAICAYSLCIITLLSFEITIEEAILHPSSIIVLGGTLIIYSIHNLYKSILPTNNHYTNRQTWSKKNKYTILSLLIIGGILCIYHLPHLTIENILVICILGGISTLYTLPLWIGKIHLMPLRQYGLIKPFLLALVWIGVTVLFPLTFLNITIQDIQSSIIIEWLYRTYMMLLLCIIFDIKDKKIDNYNNIHTLAVRFPKQLNITLNTINIGISILMVFIYLHLHAIKILPYLIASCCLLNIIQASNKPQNELFFVWNVDGIIFLYSLIMYLWL